MCDVVVSCQSVPPPKVFPCASGWGSLITLENGPDAQPEHLGIPRASELVHEPLQVLADGIGRRGVEEAPKGAEDTPQPTTRDSHLVDGVGNIRPDQWVEATHECELADQVRVEDPRARRFLGQPVSSSVVDVGSSRSPGQRWSCFLCRRRNVRDGMGLGPLLAGRRAGSRPLRRLPGQATLLTRCDAGPRLRRVGEVAR